ncbi:GntR family transcriptional regulator [Saccharothrix sp. HUAS TT1]|uniref:GntR family transcriptional regulator n=1 Tax=unclassified Saccharothrix TaxID=2593673 RepID=UPI00345BBF86
MADPAYQRIANRLRTDISRGRWKPGAKLPPHPELAALYGVSVTTARNAVLELVKENLLFTAHRQGTIVRNREVLDHVVTTSLLPDRPASSSTDVFVEVVRRAGRAADKQFSMWAEPATPRVAGWLGLTAPDDWVVVRRVEQIVDGETWGVETSYYPRELARLCGLDVPHDIPEGTTRRMADRNHGETSWVDLNTTRPAGREEAELLRIAVGTYIEDRVRIGANHEQITRATHVVRTADRNRVIYELGDRTGIERINKALTSAKVIGRTEGQAHADAPAVDVDPGDTPGAGEDA